MSILPQELYQIVIDFLLSEAQQESVISFVTINAVARTCRAFADYISQQSDLISTLCAQVRVTNNLWRFVEESVLPNGLRHGYTRELHHDGNFGASGITELHYKYYRYGRLRRDEVWSYSGNFDATYRYEELDDDAKRHGYVTLIWYEEGELDIAYYDKYVHGNLVDGVTVNEANEEPDNISVDWWEMWERYLAMTHIDD